MRDVCGSHTLNKTAAFTKMLFVSLEEKGAEMCFSTEKSVRKTGTLNVSLN